MNAFRRNFIALLFFAAALWSFDLTFPNDSFAWELAKDKDGIKVFTREIKGSSFKEYKAVMKISASLSSLVALVNDITECHLWIHTCKKGKLLKQIKQDETYTYTINNAPWPVSDRDAVVHNIVIQNPLSRVVTIRISGVPYYIPEKAGIVRVKKIEGYWRFTPIKKGIVEVVYQIHSEPGGNIPSWLVNAIVVSQPYNTLKKMREIIRRPKYRKAKYSFIKE